MRRNWVLALASVAALMVALDILVVITALTTIQRDLGASLAELEWTTNAYSLASAVLLMTGAALGDRYGRRRLLITGLAVFTAASVACALAPGVGWLIAARTVQGAGGALILPTAVALVGAAFPPERRGKAMGIFQAITGLALIAGPLLGGAVTEGVAWEWIFWLNVPIGLLAIPLILLFVGESSGPRAGLDIGGLVLSTAAALGLVWGLVRGDPAGWASAEVLLTLVAGSAFLIAFVVWERRAGSPMLPMEFFRLRAFSAGNLATFVLYGVVFGAVFFTAQFLQVALGHGPLDAGLRLVPWTATLFLVAPLAGTLADRFGARPFVAGGLILQALGLMWLALIASPDLAYSSMVLPTVVAGVGVSMAIPAAQNAVVSSVPPPAIGKAAGTFSMARGLGGVFGVAVLSAVFAGNGGFGSALEFADGYATALWVAAALSLAGALAGLCLPGRSDRVEAVRVASGDSRPAAPRAAAGTG